MKPLHKRLLVLLAAVLLLASLVGMTALAEQADPPAPVDEPACYEHGDVNGDGDVDNRDAIYTLFHTIPLFAQEYPIDQDCDFNEDTSVDNRDAIYLLFATIPMFQDQYKLDGTVHAYLEPIWTWDTDLEQPTAQMSLKCACGMPHPITEVITVTAGTVKDATCVADGSKEYTAKVTYDGTEFEDTVTVVIPANGQGHMVGEPTCEASAKCQNCDYEIPALGHSYALSGEKDDGCKHTKLYKCSVCQKQIEGTAESDVYYTHSYTAKIDTEATCSAAGKKILTCSVCQDTAEEIIPINSEFHVWGKGEKNGSVTTYTCECGKSKTVKEVAENEAVSAQTLKDTEVQLAGGAAVALDEKTVDQLDTKLSVVINVKEVDKDETNLDADEKAQVGQSKIYDFSMKYSDGSPITQFDGEVTVVLPYTLQEGDDVNAIDVWYIADNGDVECVKGVYNNKTVTFTTDHFSYYTVTRLTPAQRCAVYGHVEVTTTKAATCTEDGYTKVFCQRCGQVKQDDSAPMLGHKYEKDTLRSVDATCHAPGKTVSVCVNCKGEKTEDVKQLAHQFELTESVAADCTTKGYDKHICKLCKTEKTDNEKEAKGHDWAVAENGWAWNEDHTKATVSLVCAHKDTHTKVLTAVVSKKLEGSVCMGGEVTYTATASHNNKIFTQTVTATEAGNGQHSPDGKWMDTDTQHYQLCALCGEKVGIADHEWERTVTQAPTCDKGGKATDKCAVCDKERDAVLPATGEHSFVNGTCSACGYVKDSCSHRQLTKTKIDLSEYGACQGYVEIQSCSCGQISYLYDYVFTCEWKVVEETETMTTWECTECGLVRQSGWRTQVDEQACTGQEVDIMVLTRGDTVIVNSEYAYYTMAHPVTKKGQTVNLSDYGLCGGILTQETCACGYRSYWELKDASCQWTQAEDGSSVCSVCGVERKTALDEGRDGCYYIEDSTVSYRKNGQELFSYVIRYVYEEHDYKATDWELYGDSCEDGIYVERTCSDCGVVNGRYYEWCMPCIEQEVIDTTGVGFCSDAIEILACPCGDATEFYFVYADDAEQYHQWSYSTVNGLQQGTCANCGYQYTFRQEKSEKDDACRVVVNSYHTYTDGKGHSFDFETRYSTQEHRLENTFQFKGDSCEDGVTVTRVCADCGYSRTYTNTHHETFEQGTLDLSAYGYCNQTVTLSVCPCGGNAMIDIGGCSWQWIGGDVLEDGGQYTLQKCAVCGIICRQDITPVENGDPCKAVWDRKYTFLKDEQTLGSLAYRSVQDAHRYVYEMQLNPGAVDCNGGWSFTATCVECGYQSSGNSDGCISRAVARQTVSTEGMCDQLEKVTYRCACGKNSSTGVNWIGGEGCRYENECFDQTFGGWMYTCAVCGSKRGTKWVDTPVEGTTCEYLETSTTTYWDKDGNELVSEEYTYTWYSHTWLYKYTCMGDTCADGWTCTMVCADCGETSSTETSYGCEVRMVERTVAYENDDICGPVYLCHYSCACGAEENYDVSFPCQGRWVGNYYTCDTCGLQQTNGWSYQQIPNTCRETVDMTYTFRLNGQTVATVNKVWEQTSHVSVCTYQTMGESCEDGYYISEECVYCGHTENWTEPQYGHQMRRTGYYELPGGCGSVIILESCACGRESYIYAEDGGCSWTGSTRVEKDENGIEHEINSCRCQKCGMTLERDNYYTDGEATCSVRHHRNDTYRLDDWELTLSGTNTTYQHHYQPVSVELNGGESCEDGIICHMRCVDCGTTYTSNSNSHMKVAVSSVDLSQYGSVCGATLNLMKCACGKEQGYEVSHDSRCDLDEKPTAHWIEGVLNDQTYTSEGWVNSYSYSYTYTCAVTEPACGLKIRMSRYWLNENCTAVQYETWQLGYDAATGTCQQEITIKTGKSHGYHTYEWSSVDQTPEGGEGSKYTCTQCGSYYTDLTYRGDDQSYKYVREAVNLLKNGENQKYTQTMEYVYYGDYQYISKQRDAYVYADGSTYWYQYDFTYDFTDGCLRTEVYTNSNGESWTNTGEGHNTDRSIEWIKEPTCTQWGQYIESYTCVQCGEVTSQYTYDSKPRAHSWTWDSEKQTYVCDYCDLENANAASGNIVMEDLTERYNDGNYVIGYWIQEEDTFHPYVSLVLYDVAEDAQDELVLTGIDFTYLTVAKDGICGLRFSQEQVAAAAATALEEVGYTGSYAVRISFVPATGGNTLDYAITFDALTAE